MDKSEYLKLAHEKGWDTRIPRLEDGTYDCDIFGGDDVLIPLNVRISGNFFLGARCHTGDIFAGGLVILGEGADPCNVTAGEGFICGDNSDLVEVFVLNGSAIIGEISRCGAHISARKYVVIGMYSFTRMVSAGEDILYDE